LSPCSAALQFRASCLSGRETLNWNVPQFVTVNGVDDTVVDGRQSSVVRVSVDGDLSDDVFDLLPTQIVNFNTADNDEPGFRVANTQLNVTQAGGSDFFTVTLNAQPLTDVVIDIEIADGTVATADESRMTFTPQTWDTPQTMNVHGVQNQTIDGDRTTNLTLSIDPENSDDAFDSVGEQVVVVATTDDDVAGFTVSTSSATVSENRSTETFTVVLDAQPADAVTLTVFSNDLTEVTTSRSTITFDAGNWAAPQTITLTGVDDDSVDGDQNTTVSILIDADLSDDAFDQVEQQTVNVINSGNDTGGFVVEEPNESYARRAAIGVIGLTIDLDTIYARPFDLFE
jgi:hypothetical protein